ncbi:predicted protein [Chaetoceros tenuissimus]|uniref:Uncharacterized protein n=1 Tax=Chaetoceros tenuissimus TaxID=426638 RepID=A0AAD3CNP8_9STRA|nr:predicted protein [Chaetoceros tenuissimus]
MGGSNDNGDDAASIVAETPRAQSKRTIEDEVGFIAESIERLKSTTTGKELTLQTGNMSGLNTFEAVIQFIREHYFRIGMLTAGSTHEDLEVVQFTRGLGNYLHFFGVRNEAGFRSINPRVLHVDEVEDTTPVFSFNNEANVNVLGELVDLLRKVFQQHQRFMTIATDTVALRAILEVPVCNVTTTGGYSSVQAEKTRVTEIIIPKLVNSSDNKSWLEKVEETLVMHSLSNYLDVKDKIGTNKTLSYALVLKLLNALENSPYSYLQTHKTKVKDFCNVWSIVKNALTDKSAIYTETMKDWNMLFQNPATNREEFLDYLNVFFTHRDKLVEKKSTAITDDVFLRSLVYRQLQIVEDADTLRKLVSKGSGNETVSDVLEELKDLFTPLADEIAQSDTKLAARRTPGAVHFDDQRIPKKQKIQPPPPVPKLPVDVGKIIPPHFFSRFAQWFKIMSKCSDPTKWTAEQKKSMQAIKEELEKHASKSKEFKDMKSKYQKQGEQLKTTRRRLETLEKSSGSDQNPRWEGEQPTGGLLQSRRGPTSNTHDQYNPMGRGRGRGYTGNRYYPNYDQNRDGQYRRQY